MKSINFSSRITPRDIQTVNTFLKEIANYPLLTPDEEVTLAQQVHSGNNQARERLIVCNLRFVISVAKCYIGLGLEFDELISAGYMGLMKAVDRFNETVGVRFCSYAIWWIRQSIIASIVKEGRFVRLPANKNAQLNKINKAIEQLRQELQRTPNRQELCDLLGIEEDTLSHLLKTAERPLSLDTPLPDCDDTCLIDTIGDNSSPMADDALMKDSLVIEVESLLSGLPSKERTVLELRFGLGNRQEHSLEEIAIRENLSHERVRQIYHKAIDRLRHHPKRDILLSYLQAA